jgi:hypothetical protein
LATSTFTEVTMTDTAREVMVIRDDTTAEELVEYLTNLNAFAKRQQRITARFTNDRPTEKDKAHRRMDAPLDAILEALARLT